MNAMTSLALQLHLLLLLSNPLCQANSAANVWAPVRVDENWVTQNGTKFEERNIPSDTICAAVATQAHWSNLFCFQEGNCRLSDVTVPPFFEETQPGNIIDCKARTCPAPYQQVRNVGCILIITSLYNYSDARSQCQQRGGELVTPESFPALVQYMKMEVEGSANGQYWVGAQVSTGWHDSRAVDASELFPGEPDGTGDCYRMKGSANLLLGDNGCYFEYSVICEH